MPTSACGLLQALEAGCACGFVGCACIAGVRCPTRWGDSVRAEARVEASGRTVIDTSPRRSRLGRLRELAAPVEAVDFGLLDAPNMPYGPNHPGAQRLALI